MGNETSTKIVAKATREEWRELGFYYEIDETLQQLSGSLVALRQRADAQAKGGMPRYKPAHACK